MDEFEAMVKEFVAELWKREERRAELYEKRTEAFERIARALEHSNEKRFHSV
jgi:hypothetical protein